MAAKLPMLLIRPRGSKVSPLEQSRGAELAALSPALRDWIALRQETFAEGDLADLELKLRSWRGELSGMVAATDVVASKYAGEVADSLGVLCFVANNNPVVWQGRRHVFHIGVPTAATSQAVAWGLYERARARRLCVVYDEREFQRRVAAAAASSFAALGGEACTVAGNERSWLEKTASWDADVVYLAYSEDERALPVVRALRRRFSTKAVLVGRSLLREKFITTLGGDAEGLLAVDMFPRNNGGTGETASFLATLQRSGISVPTANHGFGWDAMLHCGAALVEARANVAAAIARLESEEPVHGATGELRFSPGDHNGRATCNPTVLSRYAGGRWRALESVPG